jgi:hypothetical protein
MSSKPKKFKKGYGRSYGFEIPNYPKFIKAKKKEAKPIILDDNPLSLAMYFEEHPDILEEIMKNLPERAGLWGQYKISKGDKYKVTKLDSPNKSANSIDSSVVIAKTGQTGSDILSIINQDRDNGNLEGGGFSPALCLSKVIKYLDSQQNPYTTAEGVKTGGTSRITPKVVPEKVLDQSADTPKLPTGKREPELKITGAPASDNLLIKSGKMNEDIAKAYKFGIEVGQQERDKEVLEMIDKSQGYIYCIVKGKEYLVAKKVKDGEFVRREELKQALKQNSAGDKNEK